MCPHWQPGSANRKMLPVLCSVLDVLPQHSSTARVLAHPAQGIAQGIAQDSQYCSSTRSRLGGSVRPMPFLQKHNGTKAKLRMYSGDNSNNG